VNLAGCAALIVMKENWMPEPDASDDTLMQTVASGGEEAFRQLMERHQGWVCALIAAIVRNDQHAEDMTQEVFWRVHQHAVDYIGQGEFVGWLKSIAINTAKDFLRKQKRAIVIGLEGIEETLPDDDRFNPATVLLTSVLREELRSAIETLPDDQRLVIIMRYFGDMNLQDIAWAMRCPLGTVKSRLFNGLGCIRKTLAGEETTKEVRFDD
jgi:RNA polymerase sigma-70 factor (ECF subfamily)